MWCSFKTCVINMCHGQNCLCAGLFKLYHRSWPLDNSLRYAGSTKWFANHKMYPHLGECVQHVQEPLAREFACKLCSTCKSCLRANVRTQNFLNSTCSATTVCAKMHVHAGASFLAGTARAWTVCTLRATNWQLQVFSVNHTKKKHVSSCTLHCN